LEQFSTIVMDNATVTISGSTLTQHNSDGTSVVSTFNITGAIGGQAYDSSETIDNASNGLLATVYHLDNGGNVYVGDASGVTSPTFEGAGDSPNAPETSFAIAGGDWTITGGGTNETFTFASLFNQAEITDYGAAFKAGQPDVVSVSTADFADWSAMLGDAAASGLGGANTAFTATTTGDKLILDGVTLARLHALTPTQAAADFKFHT
jgi:hypothetical protein